MYRKIQPRLASIFFAITIAVLLISAFFVTNLALAREDGPLDVNAPNAELRIAHLAPFSDTLSATGVDVKLDGTQVLRLRKSAGSIVIEY